MVTASIWPALDYSRVPYRLYHDTEIYAREQERIFRGPVWSYLGLGGEIPEPGVYRATWVGETPVSSIATNRARSGHSSTAARIAARWSAVSFPAMPTSISAFITNGAMGSTAR